MPDPWVCRSIDLCPWKELAQKAVGVLVSSALPRASRIGEEHTFLEVLSENVVSSHVRSVVPCQGAPSGFGQSGQHVAERVRECSAP